MSKINLEKIDMVVIVEGEKEDHLSFFKNGGAIVRYGRSIPKE